MSNNREIRRNGKIATLRQARKNHTCKQCSLPIFSDSWYWEIAYAGSGLGSTKCPTRVHVGECLEKELGEKVNA